MNNFITPCCIGIAGGSCSGKTTLENNLRQSLGGELALVPFDDFFVGTQALTDVKVDDWEDPSLYRWEDYRQALESLKTGQSTVFDANSKESKAEGISRRTVESGSLIIAAGFLALHEREVNELFDKTFFIDVPEEEIVRRRLARAKSRGPSPWNSTDYIRHTLIPGHRKYVQPQLAIANHVIDGMLTPMEIANQIISIIKSGEQSKLSP